MSEPFQPASHWPDDPDDPVDPVDLVNPVDPVDSAGSADPVGRAPWVPPGPSGSTLTAPPTPAQVSAPHAGIAEGLAAAAAGLGELDGLPVGEHVARFDAVHAILQDALTAIDSV